MPIDRNRQLRDAVGSMRYAIWSLALAGCAFDPSALGNPQLLDDIVSNERSRDAGIDDAGARASGRNAANSGEAGSHQHGSRAGGLAGSGRTEIAKTPISAGAAGGGSAAGDEDAGEDDAGSETGVVDGSIASLDAEAPISRDASVQSDAAADDASSSQRPSTEDRRFALDMLAVVVSILQANPDEDPGNLLQTLAGDVTPDAELVTEFLEFVSNAEDCDDRSEPCAPACTVVAERCDICTRDSECSDALNEACGRDRRCW